MILTQARIIHPCPPGPRGASAPFQWRARARARPPCRYRSPIHPKPPRVVPRRRTTSSLSPGWQSHRIANKRRASARHSSLALDATASDVPQHPLPLPIAEPTIAATPVRPPPLFRLSLPLAPSLFLSSRDESSSSLQFAPFYPTRIQLDEGGETGTIGTTDRQRRRQRELPLFHLLCLPSGLCCHPLDIPFDAAAATATAIASLFSSLSRFYDSCLPAYLLACLPACLLACLSLDPPPGLLFELDSPFPPPLSYLSLLPPFSLGSLTLFLPSKPKPLPSATTTIIVTHTPRQASGRRTIQRSYLLLSPVICIPS